MPEASASGLVRSCFLFCFVFSEIRDVSILTPGMGDADELVRVIRQSQADLVKYADDSQVIIKTQRDQIRMLSAQASALEQEASAEERFAAARTAGSFEARSASLQRAVEEALASLQAATQRGVLLSSRLAAHKDAIIYLKKDLASAGRHVSGPQESVALRRRGEVARARLDRTRSAVDAAASAADAARVEMDSIRKQKASVEARIARMDAEAEALRSSARAEEEAAVDAARGRDRAVTAARLLQSGVADSAARHEQQAIALDRAVARSGAVHKLGRARQRGAFRQAFADPAGAAVAGAAAAPTTVREVFALLRDELANKNNKSAASGKGHTGECGWVGVGSETHSGNVSGCSGWGVTSDAPSEPLELARAFLAAEAERLEARDRLAKLRAGLAAADGEATRLRASLASLEASHARAPARSEHLELRRQLAGRQRQAAAAASAAAREAEGLQALEAAAASLCTSLRILPASKTDAFGLAVPPSLTQMLMALEGWRGEAQFAAEAGALKDGVNHSGSVDRIWSAAAEQPRSASVSDFLSGKPATPERRPSVSHFIHSAAAAEPVPADRPGGFALDALLSATCAPHATPAAPSPRAPASDSLASDFLAVGGSAGRPVPANACTTGPDTGTPAAWGSATGGGAVARPQRSHTASGFLGAIGVL